MTKYLRVALAAAVFAGASAAPALAQTRAHNAAAQPQQLYMYAPGVLPIAPGGGADMARDQAIHDCSTQASKWSFSTWETTQLATYGSCMTEHGQIP